MFIKCFDSSYFNKTNFCNNGCACACYKCRNGCQSKRPHFQSQCRMCNSATHLAYIGSRYCADIHRSSLFLAKTLFSWLLKPSANKKGKRKTGECINFNKFIYTNKCKDTFEQFRKRRCTVAGTGCWEWDRARLVWKQLAFNGDGLCGRLHILFWHGDAAFEDMGTSSSDDEYSCAGSLNFFYISFWNHSSKFEWNRFRSPAKMWTKLTKVTHIFCWFSN